MPQKNNIIGNNNSKVFFFGKSTIMTTCFWELITRRNFFMQSVVAPTYWSASSFPPQPSLIVWIALQKKVSELNFVEYSSKRVISSL